jgi:O-antigen ligase
MRDASERWICALTIASAAAVLVSIAAAQALLIAAIALWVVARPVQFRWPRYFLPLAAFMAATILSMAFSPEPAHAIWAVRKFWLFSMGLLASHFITTQWRTRTAQRALICVGAAAGALGVVQFVLQYIRFLKSHQLADDPMILARPTGPMGHWMTFSGEQLLVWCAAIPALMFLGQRWLIPISAVMAGIMLSFTRSVWVGSIAGLAAVSFALPRRVLIQAIVPPIAIGLAASPFIVHRLLASTGDQFAPDRARISMLDVGARMVRDHPWFGVGPERIREEFPRYYPGGDLVFDRTRVVAQRDGMDVFYYGHLHSNVVQIAAERGLLCLTAFFWFLLELYRSLIGRLRGADDAARWMSLSALAALTGFVVSGFFEYNFGDSEVLLLLLFIVSIPLGVPDAQHVQKNSYR